MRNTILGVLVAAGCGGASGQTKTQMTGPIKVVFTNASAQTICELQMSSADSNEFGDNWLPTSGVATGQSVEFNVKPGNYKATWSSCKTPNQPLFAATLIGEAAIAIDTQTQLYAYVPDKVPPTSRAAARGRDFKLVRFIGQTIEAVPEPAQPAKVDSFSAAEAKLSSSMPTSSDSGEIGGTKPDAKGDAKADVKTTTKPEGKAAAKSDAQTQTKVEAKVEAKAATKPDNKPATPPPPAKAELKPAARTQAQPTAPRATKLPPAVAGVKPGANAVGTSTAAKADAKATATATKPAAKPPAPKPVAKPKPAAQAAPKAAAGAKVDVKAAVPAP